MNTNFSIYKIKLSDTCDYGLDSANMDFSDISGTNCYLDDNARLEIEKRIQPIPTAGIHFIDSGNYHYMTLLFLKRIHEPFNLFVFDNHTDYQESAFGGLISCGSWVREAADTLPYLKKIYLSGTDSDLLSSEKLGVKVFPVSSDSDFRFLFSSNTSDLHESQFPPSCELPLYISIDKDVLSKDYFKANWSQGQMTLPDLLCKIKSLINNQRILGIDICGGTGDDSDTHGNQLNLNADQAILDTLLSNK